MNQVQRPGWQDASQNELVEAAGQLVHTFRYGLDYSFTCILGNPRLCRGERVVVLPTLVLPGIRREYGRSL